MWDSQRLALECEADELFYGGQAGAGKLQGCYSIEWAFRHLPSFTGDNISEIMHEIPIEIRNMDSQVLMWDGQWKSLSEVKIGDRIMNPDGQLQEVLQTHEHPDKELYRLTFEDGTTADAGADHLWGFWEARQNSRSKTSSGQKPILDTAEPDGFNTNYITRARVRSTAWMKAAIAKNPKRRFLIPISSALNFTQQHGGRSDRAYVYGALLGDGTIQSKRASKIKLTSPDEWVIERCTSLFERFYRYNNNGKNCSDITFHDEWIYSWAHRTSLMGKYSHEKFIPPGYIKESLEFRWALAQGLFDTDGYAGKERNEVSYSTTSSRLAEDVANLVRSLGFMAKVREKQGICYTKGYEGEKRMSYIVAVEGNNRWRLFSLPRKQERAKTTEPNVWVGKRIESIEPIGKTYCRCITVSGANSLYVTDGYNVTHNSALLVGLAGKHHWRTLILRREFPQLTDLEDKSIEFYGQRELYNKSEKIWSFPDGRKVRLGNCQREDDWRKYQGQARDLLGFDELCHFTLKQYKSLAGWVRTTKKGQRCRIVATGNPPDSPEGRWVISYWAPWLDTSHPDYPAKPGELRWYVMDGDRSIEVDGPDPVVIGGQNRYPRSRTFIPGSWRENIFLDQVQYEAQLDSLPEPLRSQLMFGDFASGIRDDSWQVIPTAWVEAAMQRWKEAKMSAVPTAIDRVGSDVSRGGTDATVCAPRWGYYWYPLERHPGTLTPDGQAAAQYIKDAMHNCNGAIANIDVIGVGASAYDCAKSTIDCVPVNVAGKACDAEGVPLNDMTGQIEFSNIRAYLHWRMRDVLDPRYSFNAMLPDDPELKADLTAALYKRTPRGIQVEEKSEIAKRIGRSPDAGDAVILSLWEVPDTSAWLDALS